MPFAPNTAGIALRVADVEAARDRLSARGVEFLGETVDTGVCLMGFFYDPDGNVLILHRRYARGSSVRGGWSFSQPSTLVRWPSWSWPPWRRSGGRCRGSSRW